MLIDREDAGRKLAALIQFKWNREEAIALGIPRGGIVVANEVAKKFDIQLEPLLVKKIAHPQNDEVAIGAVSLTEILLQDRELYDQHWLTYELEKKRARIREMMEKYKVKAIPDVKNKVVFLIDDGIATGFTVQLAITLLKEQHPKELHLFVPVCPKELHAELASQVDSFYCLELPESFHAIGQYYSFFEQVDDEEVSVLLEQNKKARQ